MKSGRHRFEAIVLRKVDYGDADLIVDLFTREHGKISGLAKHGRRSRKRFGNILNPGTMAEMSFTVKTGKELVNLESGDLIESFEGVADKASLLARAQLAVEITGAFCAPLDPAPEIFDLLVWCLGRLDRGERPEAAVFVFMVRLLHAAGFGPNLDACGACGRVSAEVTDARLKTELGGLACRDCSPGGVAVSPGTVKILHWIQDVHPSKIERLVVGDSARREAESFLLGYIRHILGRELKSARVLEQLT